MVKKFGLFLDYSYIAFNILLKNQSFYGIFGQFLQTAQKCFEFCENVKNGSKLRIFK